jgi:competence protein ComEA
MPAPPQTRGWVPGPPGTALPVAAATPTAAVSDDEPAGVSDRARTVRPAAAVVATGLALAVVFLVWVRGSGSGEAVQLPPRQSVERSQASAAPGGDRMASLAPPVPTPGGTTGAANGRVLVDVEGRVRRPGLQRLPAGARVADAVTAAGGTTAGALVASLNLARVLADGEQILVPGPGDPVATPGGAPALGGGGTASVPSGAAAPVDLNAATQDGLDALPGVGPVLAGRIMAWRAQHGRFTSVDELAEVPGIGPKMLERLRPLVRV